MKDSITSSADLLANRQLQTKFGIWKEYMFRYANSDIIVLSYGNWQNKKNLMVRVHSTCTSAHYLMSVECDCREQLEMAFERITKEGRGLIVLLDQDGRGNGHAALMRAAIYAQKNRCTQSDAYRSLGYLNDSRSFHGVGIVLRKLGVLSIRLLSNNPEKSESLRVHGIHVTLESLVVESQKRLKLEKYYKYKAKEGHFVGTKFNEKDKFMK